MILIEQSYCVNYQFKIQLHAVNMQLRVSHIIELLQRQRKVVNSRGLISQQENFPWQKLNHMEDS